MPNQDVRVAVPSGGALTAAIATPADTGTRSPGVVVLHEMFGLNDDIRRIAGRFAESGYVAIAPDLLSNGNRVLCLTRLLMDGSGQRGTLDSIEAVRAHLAARDDVDEQRIAVIGFCLGGGFALAFAARGGVKVASVNYGKVPRDPTRLAGVCPVVAGYGGRDLLFRDDARRLERHLDELAVAHDVKVYPEAGHSFMSYDNGPAWMLRIPTPMNAGYVETAAEDNWRRILDFFAEHLGPG